LALLATPFQSLMEGATISARGLYLGIFYRLKPYATIAPKWLGVVMRIIVYLLWDTIGESLA